MSADTLAAVQATLAAFLDEDREEALEQACRMAADAGRLDIAALLEWVQQYRCAPQNRSRALRALRAALRLPAMPGPVCRTPSPRN